MPNDIEDNVNAQTVKELCDIGAGKRPAAEATLAGEQELTNEQRSRMPYVMAIYHDCFLCGCEPPPAGIYTWKMGGQTILTPICRECKSRVTHRDEIQRALRERTTHAN